jgi:hypothetical protein
MSYLQIDRIGEAIRGRVPTHNEELHGRIRVVDEAVGNPGARWERDGAPLIELDEVTVQPQARPPFENEYELFVVAVGVG